MNRNKDNESQLPMVTPGELIERAVYQAVQRSKIVRPARRKKIPNPEAMLRAQARARREKAAYMRRLRIARAAANLCIRCGKYPPAKPRKQCETCLDQLLDNFEARKARASG